MTHDHQTFARAATTALIGLAVQAVLTLAVGLLGLYADAPSLIAATWQLLAGVPLWFVLWLLFNQHRLERLEALEAEQLAEDDAQAAALFQEAGDQLALANRRLERLHKFGLKLTGIIVAVFLLALGGTLFYLNLVTLRAGRYDELGISSEAILALFGMIVFGGALVGFLVARYIAGMTQFEAWAALRAGASYLMGSVVVLALAGIALVMALFGNTMGFVYLSVIVPGFMIILGLEIMISVIFSLYRPVRKGEYQRPVFDSRLLGFLTQPQSFGKIITDTINYQFGFEVSTSWFYRLMAQATLPLVLLLILMVIGMSSLAIIAPQQQGVVTTFGRYDGILDPGLHFKLPWPISKVDKYDVDRVRMVIVGSRPNAQGAITDMAVLWTNPHSTGGEKEQFLMTAPDPAAGGEGNELIGGDVAVQYRIADLEAYINSVTDPHAALEDLTGRAASAAFRSYGVDELLGEDRRGLAKDLKKQIQDEADAWSMGVELLSVSIMALHPPQEQEVAAAFHEQIGALQKAQSSIEDAKKQAVSILTGVAGSPEKAQSLIDAINRRDAETDEQAKAELTATIDEQIQAVGGEAAQRLLEARARRWELAVTEGARSERFLSEYLAYQQAPRYYIARKYLETLAGAVAERRKIVLDSEATPPLIRVELKESTTGVESIFGPQDQ